MNDYIERQDAIDTHCAICPDKDKCPDRDFICPGRELFRMIKPVDAVPVVRCKDCAHNNLPPTAGNALCSIYYGMTDVYGFCHRGERREEDGTDT